MFFALSQSSANPVKGAFRKTGWHLFVVNLFASHI